MTDLRCIVCDQRIAAATETYANAWERIARERPCCGDACVARFDVDVHLLPRAAPRSLSHAEATRLLGIQRVRLVEGTEPTVVAKALLLAGVSPSAVRKLLRDVVASAVASKKVLGYGRAYAALVQTFTHMSARIVSREETRLGSSADAEAAVAAWIARFGDTTQSGT